MLQGGAELRKSHHHSPLFPSPFHQALKVPHPPTRNLYERVGAAHPCEYLLLQLPGPRGILVGTPAPDWGSPALPHPSFTCSVPVPKKAPQAPTSTQLPGRPPAVLGSCFTLQPGFLAWTLRLGRHPGVFSQVSSQLQRWGKGVHSFSGPLGWGL